MMPPSPSITCKTVRLHANSPVSRAEVDAEVTISSSNWSSSAEKQNEERNETTHRDVQRVDFTPQEENKNFIEILKQKIMCHLMVGGESKML